MCIMRVVRLQRLSPSVYVPPIVVPSKPARRKSATDGVLLGSGPEVEDKTGVDGTLFDLLEAVIDLFESPGLTDDAGAAVGMQLERFRQIDPGPDNGPHDRDALKDGLKDRQLDVVVGRQGYEDKCAASLQTVERLLARPG